MQPVRPDSELARLPACTATITPLLAELVEASLTAAARTDGDVDPTVGASMSALGYDRDFVLLGHGDTAEHAVPVAASGWQRVRLVGHTLRCPEGTRLDLGATAKAWTADRAAQEVARRHGCGVLVSLGGDIATAGSAPDGGWWVLVQDGRADAGVHIELPAGAALATSSTVSRTWVRGGMRLHHVLDPRTGAPAAATWCTVSVVGTSCVEANTLSTAAIVRGLDALPWLRELGVTARLVGAGGRVVHLGGWPPENPQ